MRSFKHIPTGLHKKPRVVNWDLQNKWIEVAYYNNRPGNRISFKKEKFSIPNWLVGFLRIYNKYELEKHMHKIRDLLNVERKYNSSD